MGSALHHCIEVAVPICGSKVAGASHVGNPRTARWTPRVKDDMQLWWSVRPKPWGGKSSVRLWCKTYLLSLSLRRLNNNNSRSIVRGGGPGKARGDSDSE